MSFGHALYYPRINLTNKNWLKHSLLFWDKLSRIVPVSVEPSDSEDVIIIQNETDFINDYRLNKNDAQGTAMRFGHAIRDYIESYPFHRERQMYARTRREFRGMEDGDPYSLYQEFVRRNGVYIHLDKIEDSLAAYLCEAGVAVQENPWSVWLKVDNEIGLLYMSFLATVISERKSLPIVTDDELPYTSSAYFKSISDYTYKNEFEYRLGNLLIKAVVPKNINKIPVTKLLTIRERYEDERAALFSEISNLTQSISEINNADVLEDALNLHSRNLLKRYNDIEKIFVSHKIETVSKLLSVSVPTTLVMLSDAVPPKHKTIVTGAGIAFGLFSACGAIRKERAEAKQDPLSYLLDLQSSLAAPAAVEKANSTIRRLFHGKRR